MISATSFRFNWCLSEYMSRYGGTAAMENHPDLANDAWTFKRLLKCWLTEQLILCAPQDIKCQAKHDVQEVHGCCLLPLCTQCFHISTAEDSKCKVPRALANDNFYGFANADLVKYGVRWIELAAASPILTCLVTYYVEGDRGHLMDERVMQGMEAINVRGNAYSFHMPWHRTANELSKLIRNEIDWDTLPQDEKSLCSVVLFNLRIGNVIN